MNSRRWKTLRLEKLTNEPLCERCAQRGVVVAAACVHHIVPVESARTEGEMEQLAFAMPNLQSLCYACHADIHKAEHSHTKGMHKERALQQLERWKARRMRTIDQSTNQPK